MPGHANWIGGDWHLAPGRDEGLLAWDGLLAPGTGVPAPVSSGRQALRDALEAVTAPRGTVLVPGLVCPAVRQAVRAAGLTPEVYALDATLMPRWEHLRERVRETGARSALLVHPAGWLVDGEAARDIVRTTGVALVEDASHTLANTPDARTLGPTCTRAAAASLRKVLPLPSGGVWLRWDQQVPPRAVEPPDRFLLERLDTLGLPPGASRHRRLGQIEDLLDRGPGTGGAAQPLLDRLAELGRAPAERAQSWRRRCRSNWHTLHSALAGGACRPVFPLLPPGVCPLGLVVRHSDRTALARHLLRQGVESTLHWALAVGTARRLTREERLLGATLLTLPCDGRYDAQDMERIAGACHAFDRGRGGTADVPGPAPRPST